MREASTVACNDRMISAICAMVMAAAPSAATGATGLERLLLIFLMKTQQSQRIMNNTSSSNDRFSDQSVKPARNSSRNSRTQKTSTETYDSTRNHRFFHEKLNEPKNSNLTEQNSRKQQETSLHRTKTPTNGGKREITEQLSDKQRTVVAPAHNHAETSKTSKNLHCGWEQVLHGPTVGA